MYGIFTTTYTPWHEMADPDDDFSPKGFCGTDFRKDESLGSWQVCNVETCPDESPCLSPVVQVEDASCGKDEIEDLILNAPAVLGLLVEADDPLALRAEWFEGLGLAKREVRYENAGIWNNSLPWPDELAMDGTYETGMSPEDCLWDWIKSRRAGKKPAKAFLWMRPE